MSWISVLSLSRGAVAQKQTELFRKLLLGKDACPLRIVDIMVDIGDLIGKADDFSFHRGRMARRPVVPDAVPHLPGQVQALAFLLQKFHHANALLIMGKTQGADLI